LSNSFQEKGDRNTAYTILVEATCSSHGPYTSVRGRQRVGSKYVTWDTYRLVTMEVWCNNYNI